MEITRPFDLLNQALGKQVLIQLKGNRKIRGTLQAFDQHMNLVLENAEALEGDQPAEKIGSMILRGDNVIYISP